MNTKPADVDLRREQGGDDPIYQAFVNGKYEGTVCKGWTRNGGAGWVVIRKDESSSLTKKNLADCKRYVAERVNRSIARNVVELCPACGTPELAGNPMCGCA